MSLFHDIKKKKPFQFFYENEYFFSLLSEFPVSPGHSLVIPNREILSFKDLNEREWSMLKNSIDEIINVLKDLDLIQRYEEMLNTDNEVSRNFSTDALEYLRENGYHPIAYNHGINDGEGAGRTVHHLHWHIIPRFKGDVDNPAGGVRNVIPKKATYE